MTTHELHTKLLESFDLVVTKQLDGVYERTIQEVEAADAVRESFSSALSQMEEAVREEEAELWEDTIEVLSDKKLMAKIKQIRTRVESLKKERK